MWFLLSTLKFPKIMIIFRWEDYLQTPLQPLADNLDTSTYSVFEKDPIKYDQYQKAIVKALIDLKVKVNQKNNNNIDDKNSVPSEKETEQGDTKNIIDCQRTFTVMVLGAGRGPLIRATFNAADITSTKVKVNS